MPLCEKRRFLRHLSPFWWAYRQRLAPQVGKKVEEKLAAGQLVAYAGRIVELKRSDCGANIVIRSRSGEHITVQAKTIVNCTGPNFDCASSSNPLLGNLMTGGWLARMSPE